MGNFGTKLKPKADTNVPKRPSGNILHTFSYPNHTPCLLSLSLSLSLSLLLFLSVHVCATVSCCLRALVTCHLPLATWQSSWGRSVKASVLKGPVSVLST